MSVNYHVISSIFLLFSRNVIRLRCMQTQENNHILIEYHTCIYTTYRLLTHMDWISMRSEQQQNHISECAQKMNVNNSNSKSQVNIITRCQLHSWLLMILLENEHKLLTSNTETKNNNRCQQYSPLNERKWNKKKITYQELTF